MATVPNDDDVNLATWLLVPLRRWRLTLGLTLLGAAGAYAVHQFLPVLYQAKAGVAIVHSRVDIPGVSAEPEPARQTTPELARQDAVVHRQQVVAFVQTLVASVQNERIEERVRQKLSQRLSTEDRQPGALTGMVEGAAVEEQTGERSKADMVQILVTGTDAAKITDIANAWGTEFETLVNSTFGVPSGGLAEISRQSQDAKKMLDDAEAALLQFKAQTFEKEGERELGEKEKVLRALRAARAAEVQDACEMRSRVRRLLVEARALGEESQKGGNPESATLALSLLKAEAYAGADFSDKGTSSLHLGPLTGLTPTSYTKDVEGLIAGLEAEQASLDECVKAHLGAYGIDSELSKGIARLEEEVRDIEKRIEADRSKGADLDSARALARRTCEAVSKAEILSQISGTEVRFTVRASMPMRPISPSLGQRLLNGALGGLVAGCVTAFIAHLGASPPK